VPDSAFRTSYRSVQAFLSEFGGIGDRCLEKVLSGVLTGLGPFVSGRSHRISAAPLILLNGTLTDKLFGRSPSIANSMIEAVSGIAAKNTSLLSVKWRIVAKHLHRMCRRTTWPFHAQPRNYSMKYATWRPCQPRPVPQAFGPETGPAAGQIYPA